MNIGIDISQLAFENTGVFSYLENLVESLVKNKNHEYTLFYSSLRRSVPVSIKKLVKENNNVVLKNYKLPPILLHIIWNKLHKIPIENFIGDIDVFITSDWTEPPVKKAKKATIIYDLIVCKYPEETHNQTGFNIQKLRISPNIVQIQKTKLEWVKKESDVIFCISESTKHDAEKILGLDSKKLQVIYPGLTI